MIKLKNGFEVDYNEDFDIFFKNLIESIIYESQKGIVKLRKEEKDKTTNELLIQEIMDNSIFVSHQIIEMSKVNEKLSKFIVAGSIFNCILLSFNNFKIDITDEKDKDMIH
ncbi:MAG: hypothetical protein SVR08_07115 [Spirochaetota bacterium]|nr:hypothetical protein [Spirochaetota bacterium]